MKRLKSLLSLALVLVMVLSLTVPALAGGSDSYRWPNDRLEAPKAENLNVDIIIYCLDCQACKYQDEISDTTASIGHVSWNSARSRYECTVTVSPTALPLDLLHNAVTPAKQSFVCYYNTYYRIWVPEVDVVYFTTTCDKTPVPPTPGTGSYSITYKSSGNWPTGVSLPSTTYGHKYGDKVTLQLPAKTVVAGYSGNVPGYWVFDGWTVYNGSSNCGQYYHHPNCGYDARGVWHCDPRCCYYEGEDTWSYLDILRYCREEGIRLSDLELPLSFKPTGTTTGTTTSSNNGPYYAGSCGHANCTGKYCDVYYACDHDECPREYCKYWYGYTGPVCSHSNCPDGYCRYWDDDYYYNYYYGYYYPSQTITVTGDMTVYGSWSFHAAAGTLVISASTQASSVYQPESYTFEIYSAGNTTKPVKTVTVKAGSNQYVSLENGTYYVYAVNANVAGYNHDVTVSGDVNTDGAKIVLQGNAVQVKYTHLYSNKGVALNTTDHAAYLTGFADGTIRPEDYITREQVATILYRLMTDESRAMYQTSSNSFSDVKSTRWSNTAISTLVNAGVMSGSGNGQFKPADNMTRAELVTALVNITGASGGRLAFTDTAKHWANNAINAAAAQGWITGYADGSFNPNGYLTRAEVAAILNRVLGRNPGSVADLLDGMKTFTDNQKTTKWYYLDIQEAANGHSYKRDNDGTEYWTGLK